MKRTATAGPGVALYVYALLAARMPAPRVRRHTIEILEVDRLFAAVERVTTAPALTEAALRDQHRIVLRLSSETDAILPARFGALMDQDELERVVRLRRAALRTALRQVRGRQQMTVRVFGPAPARRGALVAASGTDYLLARARSSRAFLPPLARAICRAVRPLAVLERVDPGRGGVQATMHHLIQRDSIQRYLDLVDATVSARESPPAVAVSGPFPPFAFTPDLWSERVGDEE
jgi:hypothetical protein